MKTLKISLTGAVLITVLMAAFANLPVVGERKCDKCIPTPVEPCCDEETGNGVENGCVNMRIPFGEPTTEYEISQKGYFQIFSLKPSAAVFSPQGLQYYNLSTNRIGRNLHQVPASSLPPDLLLAYSRSTNPNEPPGISGPPQLYFKDETGEIFPGESIGISDTAVIRYVTILTTNHDSLEFFFKSGDKSVPLSGVDKNANYILAMVDGNGVQVSTDPVYYDLYMTNGDRIRYSATTNECISRTLPTGRVITSSMPSIGVEVLYDEDNIIRQVYSVRDGLADVVVIQEEDAKYAVGIRYEIRLYDYADAGVKASTGYYIPTGEPSTVWSIECPVPNQINELRIVKKNGGISYSYYYTFNLSVNDWVLDYPDNLVVVSKEQSVAGKQRIQTSTTKNASGEVAYIVQDIIDLTPNGDRLKSRIIDPNGLNLRTDYTYTVDGRKASKRGYDGYWERYVYDDLGRQIEVTSPWKNAGSASAQDEAKVTSYGYTPIFAADTLLPTDQRPREVRETVLGVLTSKTLKAYYTSGGCYYEEVRQCAGDVQWNAMGNLKTIRQYYAGSADAASRGRIWKITYPDNTMDTHTYEYGNWMQAATPSASSFTSGGGDALRVSVVHGTKDLPGGATNQSTKDVTIYDLRGNVVQREQQLCTGGGNYERISWEVMSYNGENQKIATVIP